MNRTQKITLGIGLIIAVGYFLHPPMIRFRIDMAALFCNIMVLAIICGGFMWMFELLKKTKGEQNDKSKT